MVPNDSYQVNGLNTHVCFPYKLLVSGIYLPLLSS